MKQRILNAITAMLLILTLTMANVIMLCVDVVSYAADSIDSSTSHKNVEFMAYFKDANGNKTTSMDAKTNAEDLKLYFQVAVNKEGYFNGNIVLNNANFRLKSNILSDSVSKIENNVVYLNQINAGENKEIEVGIELLKDEQFDLNYIDMGSSVSIKGTYKDGTQKDININTDKKITLNLVRPYDSADDAIMLSQEVITNKILKVNGQEKRIVQLQVKSGLNNNLYPVKETIVNIQAPKISNRYPENVIVNANDVLTTTGKELVQVEGVDYPEYIDEDDYKFCNFIYTNNIGGIGYHGGEAMFFDPDSPGKYNYIKFNIENNKMEYINLVAWDAKDFTFDTSQIVGNHAFSVRGAKFINKTYSLNNNPICGGGYYSKGDIIVDNLKDAGVSRVEYYYDGTKLGINNFNNYDYSYNNYGFSTIKCVEDGYLPTGGEFVYASPDIKFKSGLNVNKYAHIYTDSDLYMACNNGNLGTEIIKEDNRYLSGDVYLVHLANIAKVKIYK